MPSGASPTRRSSLDSTVLIAGALSSVLLAFSMTPAFSSVAAVISDLASGAGTGSLVMQESTSAGSLNCSSLDGGSISANASTCATISSFGGTLVPGQTATETITLSNVGTVPASSFTLAAGSCGQAADGPVHGDAQDLCDRIRLSITSGGSPIFDGTAAELSGRTLDVLTALDLSAFPSGRSVPIRVASTLDPRAGNDYQGLSVTQALQWTFAS